MKIKVFFVAIMNKSTMRTDIATRYLTQETIFGFLIIFFSYHFIHYPLNFLHFSCKLSFPIIKRQLRTRKTIQVEQTDFILIRINNNLCNGQSTFKMFFTLSKLLRSRKNSNPDNADVQSCVLCNQCYRS